MTTALRRTVIAAVPLLVFIGAAIAFAPEAAVGRATLAPYDLIEGSTPYRETLRIEPKAISPIQGDQIEVLPNTVNLWHGFRHGEWRVFSPEVGSGMPSGSVPIFGVYSVFNVGFLVLPTWVAMTLRILAILVAMQFGCYLFTRAFGVGRAASTLIAVAFAFNGSSIAFLNRLTAGLLLPWLLWAILRAIDRPRLGRLAAVAAIVAVFFFEGYVPMFVNAVAIAAVFTLFMVLWRWRVDDDGNVRTVSLRLCVVAGAMLLGLGLSAFVALPFAREITSSGNLTTRDYDANAHLPESQFWGLLDETTYGDPLSGGLVNGTNTVEGLNQMGVPLLVLAGLGFIGLASGMIAVTERQRPLALMFLVATPIVLLLMYFRSPLLGLFYKVPIVGQAPATRLRFLGNWGLAVVAGLAVDAVVRRRPKMPTDLWVRVTAGLSGIAVVWMGVASADDFSSVIRASGRGSLLAAQVIDGGLLAVLAVALVFTVQWGVAKEPVVAAGLGVIVILDLVIPMRNFQAQVKEKLDFPETRLHREIRRLAGTNYRVGASGENLPFNSSMVYGYLDLRGHGLHTAAYKQMVVAAAPAAFSRDPLKMILSREEWNPQSPIWDELSFRYLVLASAEQPYGTESVGSDRQGAWSSSADRVVFELPDGPPEPVGVGLLVRRRGTCGPGAPISVRLTDEAGHERSASHPLAGDGSALEWFATTGDTLQAGPRTLAVSMTPVGGCALEVASDGAPDGAVPVHHLVVDDPADGVRLVKSDDGQLYERPSAFPLVSATTSWKVVKSEAAALTEISHRPLGDTSAPLLVTGDAGRPRDPGAAVSVADTEVAGSVIRTKVTADQPAIVVARQNARWGFVARVDGVDQPLLGANGLQLAVKVPAGIHTVEFVYTPRLLTLGRWVSLLSIVVLLAMIWWGRRGEPVIDLLDRWGREPDPATDR